MKKSAVNQTPKKEFSSFDEWRSEFLPTARSESPDDLDAVNLVDALRIEMQRQAVMTKMKSRSPTSAHI